MATKMKKKPAKKAAKKPATKAKPAARKAAPKKAVTPKAAPAAPPPPPPVWVWHECMTSDVVGAKSFYVGLLGWTAKDVNMGTGPYTIFQKDGKDVAGCMAVPAECGGAACPPNWCAYVAVADVDATAKKAAELGGKVVAGPMDVPGIGRFATIVDPQGACLAVFTPSM
jgi:predicted enzyme related to lactoylglutathione lyase